MEGLISSIFVITAFLSFLPNPNYAEPQVPCFFIFGDSLSDAGNNNYLQTSAKVNYPPYGIDYPQGSTGRFSNGRTIQDVIVGRLGFPTPIPTFASAKGNAILQGVNYASGAAGILSETAKNMGDRISMDSQLKNQECIVLKIVEILGKEAASDHLSKCIYSVYIGSNDYINNYFLPQFYQTSHQYTRQIQSLYGFGARKLALFALGAIGCTPHAVAVHGTKNGSPCIDEMNYAASLFTTELPNLVKELNNNFTDAFFTYINPNIGFTLDVNMDRNSTCCQVAKGEELCARNSVPCPDRSKYVFWDGQHPTEAINVLAGDAVYASTLPKCAYPFNFQTLAQQ